MITAIEFLGLIYPNRLKENFIAQLTEALPKSDATDALIDKTKHMLCCRGGLYDVLIMFHSFRYGPKKRLRSNPKQWDHNEQYEYEIKSGNEKLRHKGNLPKGHFRWNYGKRYLLSKEEVEALTRFMMPFYALLDEEVLINKKFKEWVTQIPLL